MPLDAGEAGLNKVSTEDLVIRRVKRGRATKFVRDGKGTVAAHHAARIAALAIPPAWTHVRISDDPSSHIQAVGRDAAGRLQYIYHPDWENIRTSIKTERLKKLLVALPRIRRGISLNLKPRSPLSAQAAAARLIDRLALRVGHEAYAGEESGRGAATLLKRHVRIEGTTLKLAFPGKGGKRIEKEIKDSNLVGVLQALQKIPGKRLFKIKTPRGYRNMTATDVNDFLAGIAKQPVTAKDFRTLLASCCAISELTIEAIPGKEGQRRRVIARVAKSISEKLCNTPAIVRKSYIDAGILRHYEAGTLRCPAEVRPRRGCSKAEAMLLDFLDSSGVGLLSKDG